MANESYPGMIRATGTNPVTGVVESCTIFVGFYGWQDGVKFDNHSGASGPGQIPGANEIPDLTPIKDTDNG